MSLSRWILALWVVFAASGAYALDGDLPKEKIVEINSPVTKLVVDILPGRGVKCIFPWVLDENSAELPYTGILTNNRTFEQFREEGQNYIVYKIKAADMSSEGELGDAFVNVAGFHFSMTLRVNFSRKAHYSTIIYKLSEANKLDLIEKAIKRRQEALIKEYRLKEEELDQRAEKMALKLVGRLATSDRDTSNIKEEQSLKLSNGDRIVFYADRIISYGAIHVIPIEVKNDSGLESLYLKNISLEKLVDGGSYPLISEFEMPPKLAPDETGKGFIVTNDSRVLSSEDAKMTLFCDRGKVELQW